MNIIFACFLVLLMITFLTISWVASAPPFFNSISAMNSTVYRLGSSTVQTHWNIVSASFRYLYPVVLAMLIVALIGYLYLQATKKEYLTGGYPY